VSLNRLRLSCSFLLTSTLLAVCRNLLVFLFFAIIGLLVLPVCAGRDPKSTFAVALQWLVLPSEVNTLTLVALAVLATLRERAGTSAKLGGHGCVLLDPVGESVLTILDDAVQELVSEAIM